jgi:hypothetical protein
MNRVEKVQGQRARERKWKGKGVNKREKEVIGRGKNIQRERKWKGKGVNKKEKEVIGRGKNFQGGRQKGNISERKAWIRDGT